MNSAKKPWPPRLKPARKEQPISKHDRAIDSDLARDNLENDIPEGNLNDL